MPRARFPRSHFNLIQDAAGLNFGNPKFDVTLRYHTHFQRLLGDRYIWENTNPDLPPRLDERVLHVVPLDLTRREATPGGGLQRIFTEMTLAPKSPGRYSAFVHLAEFSSFGLQHGSSYSLIACRFLRRFCLAA